MHPVGSVAGTLLDHVGIAVADLDAALAVHAGFARHAIAPIRHLPDHGIAVAFLDVLPIRIELIAPIGTVSPIRHILGPHTVQDFLARMPAGGLHHICYAVPDLSAALSALAREGVRPIGEGRPIIGAAGHPILFLDPATTAGTLIELKGAIPVGR